MGQEPVLFARSVQENITYGLKDIAMDLVVEAATKANAHGFIGGLSQGYETGEQYSYLWMQKYHKIQLILKQYYTKMYVYFVVLVFVFLVSWQLNIYN